MTSFACYVQGSYPFSETNFQNFSRNEIDFSRALKITPYTPKILNVNSPYCLPYTLYFLVEFNRYPELSRTSGVFPGLSSHGKCQKKIPRISRFLMTRSNPHVCKLRMETQICEQPKNYWLNLPDEELYSAFWPCAKYQVNEIAPSVEETFLLTSKRK